MKKFGLIAMVLMAATAIQAQDVPADSAVTGKVIVHKDPRIEALANKQGSGGGGTGGTPVLNSRFAKGYRLMIINTDDRDKAMRIRSQLLQRFPEQKAYMIFKPPYIQVKFGNFVEKGEADRYKTLIRKSGIVTNNIFAVPETVEVKPQKETDKDKDKDDKK